MSGYLNRMAARAVGDAPPVVPVATPVFGARPLSASASMPEAPTLSREPDSQAAAIMSSLPGDGRNSEPLPLPSMPMWVDRPNEQAEPTRGVVHAVARALAPVEVTRSQTVSSAPTSLQLPPAREADARPVPSANVRAEVTPVEEKRALEHVMPVTDRAPVDRHRGVSEEGTPEYTNALAHTYAQLRSVRETPATQPAPVVRVTIGRVEIRAIQAPQSPAQELRAAPTANSNDALATFLSRTNRPAR